MISWEQAEKLSANDFAKEMLKELGSDATYKTLACLIYRSQSRMQTWCSPSSKEPLPISERHHLWCVIRLELNKKRQYTPEQLYVKKQWSKDADKFLTDSFGELSYKEIASELKRTVAAVKQRAAHLGLKH